MKRIQWLLLILLVAGTILVIRLQNTAPYHNDKGEIFGTYYSVTYQNDRELHAEILKALNEVDSSLSMFNPNSTVSKVNRGEGTTVDRLFEHLFPRAQKISDRTGGAFDITVAPLVNAWGFGFKEDKWPSQQVVDSIMAFVGYGKVSLKDGKVKKEDPRTMIDLSAIAKGYGADRVAKVLDRAKVRNYLVEIGGEVVARGTNEKGGKWRIGVAKPTDMTGQEDCQCILQLSGQAVATSGNYRNFHYKDGVKYAHTINPKTGYPVQQDIISATVVAPECYEADAFATSFMVMGLEKAKAVLNENSQLDAYLIYIRNGKQQVWMTEGFKKYLAE